jgi:hypothetical protein
VGIAVTELPQRFDLPLVLLAAVVLELEYRQPLCDGGEQA